MFSAAPTPEPDMGEESGASGAGDLVRGVNPVSPGPDRPAAIRPDHQVGDAAIVEGEAEPAFGRELWRMTCAWRVKVS